MDVLTPGSSQMLLGFLAWFAVAVGATAAVALDLRRRGVAAWWVASGLTLLVLPVGLVAYAVLRSSGARDVRSAGR